MLPLPSEGPVLEGREEHVASVKSVKTRDLAALNRIGPTSELTLLLDTHNWDPKTPYLFKVQAGLCLAVLSLRNLFLGLRGSEWVKSGGGG